jgi:hypothetical protein
MYIYILNLGTRKEYARIRCHVPPPNNKMKANSKCKQRNSGKTLFPMQSLPIVSVPSAILNTSSTLSGEKSDDSSAIIFVRMEQIRLGLKFASSFSWTLEKVVIKVLALARTATNIAKTAPTDSASLKHCSERPSLPMIEILRDMSFKSLQNFSTARARTFVTNAIMGGYRRGMGPAVNR